MTAAETTEWRLYIGRHDTGIVIRPDGRYPEMWRVLWPDDRLSPMGNLTRCKDAARVYARPRGLGGGGVVHWHRRETRCGAPPAGDLDAAATPVAGRLGPPWRPDVEPTVGARTGGNGPAGGWVAGEVS